MEKKFTLINKIKKVLLVLSIIAFLFGVVTAHQAGKQRTYARAADKIEVTVTDKTNKQAYSSEVTFTFSFRIKNDSDLLLNEVIGIFKVSDADGNLLSTGEATFYGDIRAEDEAFFTLNWSENVERGADIWYAECSDLTYSFQITEVCFEDEYENTEVDCDPQVTPAKSKDAKE